MFILFEEGAEFGAYNVDLLAFVWMKGVDLLDGVWANLMKKERRCSVCGSYNVDV